jgi:Family of unknown function (DUF5995)
MLAKTIDDAVDLMGDIITDARTKNSRIGYFTTLYRMTTMAVKIKCREGGYFEDDERMRTLDIIFANRYLAAVDGKRQGQNIAQSWDVSFQALQDPSVLIMQHLFLGINAHISLDLGVAVAQLSPHELSDSLYRDFNRVNGIIEGLTNDVTSRLTRVSPLIGLVNRVGGRLDEALSNFSTRIGRDAAWHFAQQLVITPLEQRENVIKQRDMVVAEFGRRLWRTGTLLILVKVIVGLSENKNVGEVLDVLQTTTEQLIQP